MQAEIKELNKKSVVYETKINIVERIKCGEIYSIDFKYHMGNVLGERYYMSANAHFYDTGEEVISTYLDISGISKNDMKGNSEKRGNR